MNRKLKILGVLTVLSVGMVLGLKYLFPLIAPFLLGIFFACLIEPLVTILEVKLGMGRKYATATVLIFLVVLVITLIGLTIAFTYQELQRLVAGIPYWSRWFVECSERILRWLEPVFPEIHQIVTKIYLNPEFISQLLRSVMSGVFNILPRFPQIFVIVFWGAVSAYFFSRDKQIFTKLFLSWLSPQWQQPVERLKNEALAGMTQFLRMECGLVLSTVILTTASLSLTGIAGAPAYGFLAGILDFIPVLGPGLIYIPVSISLFLTENYLGMAVVLAGYFCVLFIRQVAELKTIGENLNIHPLATLLVAYIGSKIFGVMGFFLGPLWIIALKSGYRLLSQSDLFVL